MPTATCWNCHRLLSEAAPSPHFCNEECALSYWTRPSPPPETGRDSVDREALRAAQDQARSDWEAERVRFSDLAESLAPALLALCDNGWSLRSIAEAAHISTFLPARLLDAYINRAADPDAVDRCRTFLDCGHGYRLLDSCPSCDADEEHTEAACDPPDDEGVHRLGEGVLGWTQVEADTGRWGTVLLTDATGGRVQFPAAPHGQRGTLTATVLAHRSAAYTGTRDRPATGHTTSIGEVVELGCGELFCDADVEGAAAIALGVRPPWTEAHHLGWLDIDALHQVVGQQVRLDFTPEPDQSTIRAHLSWDASGHLPSASGDPFGRHQRVSVLLTALLTEQFLAGTGGTTRSLWALDRTGRAVTAAPVVTAEGIAQTEAEGVELFTVIRSAQSPPVGPGTERLGLAWCMTSDLTWQIGGITAVIAGRVHRLSYDRDNDDIRAGHDEFDRWSEAESGLVAALAASNAWRTV
ncbi:hypothetical protein AB0B28_06480 [Glycomyces sp. NPDC046736]|uniref:hypothetical protein n=1 Tax=Glycomyces sp. NPDC046736 TaxID=3155615 RepID=UPI0033F24C7D